MKNENSSNPIVHINNIKNHLKEIVDHLRTDVEKISDLKCQAMFEVSAEVIIGLIKAFDDYKNKNEKAWK